MRNAIILNPSAGNGRCLRRWNKQRATLRDIYGPIKYCPTQGPGHATRLARSLLEDGIDHIISGGGDGTHFEVINGWFNEDTPINPLARLTVLPMGTGSDLARSLGIAPGLRGLEPLRFGHSLQADVGKVTCLSPEDNAPTTCYFLNMGRIGMGAVACRYVNEHSKTMGGLLSYLRAVILSLCTYRDAAIAISIDGRPMIEGLTKDFSIAKGRFDAGGMLMAPHARLDNGLFDCYHIGPIGFLDALRSLPKLYAGRMSERRDVVKYLRATQIHAESTERVAIEVDGEFIGYLPVTVSLLPGVLPLTCVHDAPR